MGIIHPGPPEDLVLRLAQTYRLKCFIETGTYLARTALWAGQHFETVWTIEASDHLYEDAIRKYKDITNVHFMLGDSRVVLKRLAKGLQQPALFWLDGHYSGEQTYGADDECPLIEEIHAIVRSPIRHFVIIDDSRMFLSPPPEPHKMEQWPTISQVVQAFNSEHGEYYLVVVEDVIIAVPEFAKSLVAGYCREKNTLAWNQYVKSLSAPR